MVAYQEELMEYASIEREIHIDAPPSVVFDVVSSPEHVRGWWNADTDFEATPGSTGELVWADGDDPRAHVEQLTVVVADRPKLFSFRWTQPAGEAAREGNSNLVTFELVPSGGGTLLRFTETGFRERGWEAAVLEQRYLDHSTGWDRFVPRIQAYAQDLAAS